MVVAHEVLGNLMPVGILGLLELDCNMWTPEVGCRLGGEPRGKRRDDSTAERTIDHRIQGAISEHGPNDLELERTKFSFHSRVRKPSDLLSIRPADDKI